MNKKFDEDKLLAARDFFSGDRYATECTGIVIEAVGEKYAECSLKLLDVHKNAVGHIMGGVMFTLADFTFAVATNFEQEITVSVTSCMNNLSSPKGDELISKSRLIKDGKRNCFYEIDITDNLGTPVAMVSITGAHLGIEHF